MDGFVIVDKPKGITSFGVIREARKMLNTRKIGHLGTLDPLATGVLVLAVNQTTKLVEFFMKADKEYVAEIRFGSESNTYDAEGEIIFKSDRIVSRQELEGILPFFQGRQWQMPPVFSAVKVQGRKACDIVRRGGKVDLEAKKINIYGLSILEYRWPLVTLLVKCGSGTYIRSLAHDLGKKLGTGAYLFNLNRTLVGKFALEGAVQLENLSENSLRSSEDMVEDWPKWELPEFVYGRLKSGLSVAAPMELKKRLGVDNRNFPLLAAFVNGYFRGVLEWGDGGDSLKFKKQII